VDLAAELAGEPEEGGSEPISDLDFVNLGNVHLVNLIDGDRALAVSLVRIR
jgi:hypothetical protein